MKDTKNAFFTFFSCWPNMLGKKKKKVLSFHSKMVRVSPLKPGSHSRGRRFLHPQLKSPNLLRDNTRHCHSLFTPLARDTEISATTTTQKPLSYPFLKGVILDLQLLKQAKRQLLFYWPWPWFGLFGLLTQWSIVTRSHFSGKDKPEHWM